MTCRKYLLFATTALLAGAGCTENDTPAITSQELGMFGLPVGEPINVISATRGDGVAFDKFQVTFNNAEGTDITITTPEGESINMTEADLEWAGFDPAVGTEIAKFTSSRGDRVDVVLGSAQVPAPPPPEPVPLAEAEVDQIDVVALGRLDEVDTRAGFESYGVAGQLTDPANLPRYQEDVFVGEQNEIVTPAGSLAEGTAWYNGGFLASVFVNGEVRSDSVSGWSQVGIDFAGGDVNVFMEGGYISDDVDDVAPDAVVGINVNMATIDGIEYVSSVTPVYGPITGTNIVTGLIIGTTTIDHASCGVFTCSSATVIDSVTPIFGTVINTNDIVTNISVNTLTTNDTNVVTGVSLVTASENDDFYEVSLSGQGTATDISFDNGVQYSGELGGSVEVANDQYGNTNFQGVGGTFAGAVFGPGAGADTVDPSSFGEVVDATATAGVFEAGGGGEGGDPAVQIVGGYIAESSGFSADSFEPVPAPEPEPQPVN